MPRPLPCGRSSIAIAVLLTIASSSFADDRPANPITKSDVHFAAKVLPLFKTKCAGCHMNEPRPLRGEFDMRTRESILRGGKSGAPALLLQEPSNSPLYLAIGRNSPDWSAMPPKENDRLSPEESADVLQWIRNGAPWPSDAKIAEIARLASQRSGSGVRVKTSGGLTESWTNRTYKPADLWAFQPLKGPQVPASSQAHPIDAFLELRQKELGLTPAPLADRRTMIRRVTFDLTGLPPSPREVDAFVRDPREDDVAYGQLIERLLASPHYGERMAQHWLDVTRYADSAGFANDYERGNAWRYRDYVVRSFNADKPYSRFVQEQIAGDEIDPSNPECLVAVGFLRMGPWELTGMEVAKVARQRFLDDVTEAVGQALLAQPLQCARCHDHKFDPIPTRDYYAIQAVFATTQIAERDVPFSPEESRAGFQEKSFFDERQQRLEAELRRLQDVESAARALWEKEHGKTAGRKPERHQYVSPAHLGMERIARKGLERLKWQLDRYQPVAHSVYSGKTPELRNVSTPLRMVKEAAKGEWETTSILAGGDPFSPTEAVTPGVLSAADAGSGTRVPNSLEGRRRAFAEWVASTRNPLTYRVLANRVWTWHFGAALAGNPNNFGATGKKPTHPELLDWLADYVVRENGSIKSLHRLILTSAAYRRSTRAADPKSLAERDPMGSSLAAFASRRLTAEETRDAMLRVTGELNLQVGGLPCRPELNTEVAFQPRQVMGTFAEAWQPNPLPRERHRRSLYVLRLRGLRDPFFEVLNQPGSDASCELREKTMTSPQALALLNSEFSRARALTLADDLLKRTRTDREAIGEAHRRLFGREPTSRELDVCLAHWQAMTARHEGIVPKAPVAIQEVVREAVEENTGEKFTFREPLEMLAVFQPDLRPVDCSARVRGLAEVCLVLFNANEFVFVD